MAHEFTLKLMLHKIFYLHFACLNHTKLKCQKYILLLVIYKFSTNLAHADALENEIYRQSLIAYSSLEKASQIAVLDSTVSAQDMVRIRVPRHQPFLQFTRNIPGVTSQLELSLMYFNLQDQNGYIVGINRPGRIERLELKPSDLDKNTSYMGIMSLESLNLQLKTIEQKNNYRLDVVKFSKIGFYLDEALVYAESILVSDLSRNMDSYSYGAYGLLFKLDRSRGSAHLVTIKPLWSGSISKNSVPWSQ